ncbi:MAG: uncharacterized protein K0R48_702 [Gammaproteobacteria bacterium]|jgi:uncharacterized protein YciI|nr:uncharacterized protein [Gammaproteobacteria bacterium]
MLIIELTYQKPLSEIEKYLVAHREWLDQYYEKGLLIASGPKHPRDGGIIIALTDKETAAKLIQEDPFYKQGLAHYKITEFEPVKYCKELAQKILE